MKYKTADSRASLHLNVSMPTTGSTMEGYHKKMALFVRIFCRVMITLGLLRMVFEIQMTSTTITERNNSEPVVIDKLD
jgi:hypothetical protein